jgi:hypothetical protein
MQARPVVEELPLLIGGDVGLVVATPDNDDGLVSPLANPALDRSVEERVSRVVRDVLEVDGEFSAAWA